MKNDEEDLQSKSEVPSSNKVFLFNINVSMWSTSFQFVTCVGGVFLFYLFYGYFQEYLFRIPGFKPHGWYLTLVQFAFYSAFSCLESILLNDKTMRCIPIKTYALLALLTVTTIGMSNASLGYLNYPTQVIFKCCKLIPVMLGGILIQGKKYGVLDFISCLLLSMGLALFVLADSTVSPEFNYTGVLFMSLALCADAAIGNVQEKSMKSFSPSNNEVVFYSYSIGFVYIFVGLLLNGMLKDGFIFYTEDPLQKYGYTFLFSFAGYLGMTFVLTFIRLFGALLTVTVTTCRKAVSIIVSFMAFEKPFTSQYVWSGLIVLCGIFLNVYQKNKQQFTLEKLLSQFGFCKAGKRSMMQKV